ncbi:GNAT family N-acetyltransferase [Clostridium sporogenes]|uniref:GNAT family N-acetyltransferase n=2 Tax=Clostridium TaxID=1485 RepID=UPI003DA59972
MNINDIKFRTAEKNDIDYIMEIEQSSFSKIICEDKDVFLQRIETFKKGFIVMEYYNKVIGYICSEIWAYSEKIDKDKFTFGHLIKDSHKANDNEVYISSMGILPKVRGYGLGKAMFEFFIKYIPELVESPKSILLIVSESWTNARNIYINYGFKEICILNEFIDYKHVPPFKENAIVMRKLL